MAFWLYLSTKNIYSVCFYQKTCLAYQKSTLIQKKSIFESS